MERLFSQCTSCRLDQLLEARPGKSGTPLVEEKQVLVPSLAGASYQELDSGMRNRFRNDSMRRGTCSESSPCSGFGYRKLVLCRRFAKDLPTSAKLQSSWKSRSPSNFQRLEVWDPYFYLPHVHTRVWPSEKFPSMNFQFRACFIAAGLARIHLIRFFNFLTSTFGLTWS